MSKALNFVLGFGLLGAITMALVTPFIIKVLFTPPVSFGTNCEPAAAWSMDKLHAGEAVGLVLGMIFGLVIAIQSSRRHTSKSSAGEALKTPA